MFTEDPQLRSDGRNLDSNKAPVGMTAPLDKPEIVALHRKLLGHYVRELERQYHNRREMAEDEAFYDHEQWTDEERAILEERGQLPLQFNVIFTAVNWVLGTQRDKPYDYRILPRRKEGSAHAERKSELLKYLDDVDHMSISWSRAFGEQVKAGLSWVETGARDPEDGETVYQRYESYRNMIYDSAAQEWDLSDARYMMRVKWMDLDRAQAMFPHRKFTLEDSVESVYSHVGSTHGTGLYGDDTMDSQEIEHFNHEGVISTDGAFSHRRRVRLIECWYQAPANETFVRGGDFNGEIYDPYSDGHTAQVQTGTATLHDRVKERVHVALMCEKGMIWNGPSPYRHNRFPFTPLWGYRRAKDGQPYGMIRGIKDLQRDLNKRASKMLHHLSAQRVYVEEGSVADMNLLRDEAHRPDAFIVYKQGQARPVIDTDFNIAAAHGELMSRDIEMIEKTSGVTDENMGRETNAQSGKAIIARQDQGRLTTATFFQNYRHARKLHGEKVLANVEQFFTDARSVRITDERGRPQYLSINDPLTEDDDMITLTKADFVITDEDQHATARQANLSRLMEALQVIGGSNPELVTSLLDLLVEVMDIPQADEIVKRIRQVTGQIDPDYDPTNPDPEIEAMIEAQKANSALQQRMLEAEVVTKEAEAAEKKAKADKLLAEIDKIVADVRASSGPSSALDKMEKAIRMAAQVRGVAGIGAVADMLMAEAEAMAAGEQATMAQPAALAPPMQPDPMMQQDPMQPDPMAAPIDPMTGQPIPEGVA